MPIFLGKISAKIGHGEKGIFAENYTYMSRNRASMEPLVIVKSDSLGRQRRELRRESEPERLVDIEHQPTTEFFQLVNAIPIFHLVRVLRDGIVDVVESPRVPKGRQ